MMQRNKVIVSSVDFPTYASETDLRVKQRIGQGYVRLERTSNSQPCRIVRVRASVGMKYRVIRLYHHIRHSDCSILIMNSRSKPYRIE